MNDLDMAIIKERVEEIRTDVKLMMDSLGSIDRRYHEMHVVIEKLTPRVDDNRKRIERIEPVVLFVAAIPVVLGGIWAVIEAVLKLAPLIHP